MKFMIEFVFDTEFDVEDKFELTKEQIKELEREFYIKIDQYGLFDMVEEELE